jgi:hypothetical protein
MGARHLRHLLGKTDNNLRKALIACNHGLGGLRRNGPYAQAGFGSSKGDSGAGTGKQVPWNRSAASKCRATGHHRDNYIAFAHRRDPA